MVGGEGKLIEMHLHVCVVDLAQCSVMKEQKSFVNILSDKVVFYLKNGYYFKVYIFFFFIESFTLG